jgi:hypothetical protein
MNNIENNSIKNQLDFICSQLKHIHSAQTELQKTYGNINQSTNDERAEKNNPHVWRNFLLNDSTLSQKLLILSWKTNSIGKISAAELSESGFRVFSQNDEDGIVLRIFSLIGAKNKCVVEIGSNCANSSIGIPENISTNLVIHHNWHAVIFEIDAIECSRIQYFYARNFETMHFSYLNNNINNYFSPLIVNKEITENNIDQSFHEARIPDNPDLMVIDIDGNDFSALNKLSAFRPRVVIIEFERRFNSEHSVVQYDKNSRDKQFNQSGSASLAAWHKLMQKRGYNLVALSSSGFNAFFVLKEEMRGTLQSISPCEAIYYHPILSNAPESFWLKPDETWSIY